MKSAIRIQKYIALFSVLLFAGKLWAWYLTHSVAILTDALESTVNVITGFIGWYSISLAAKPRDANHPYGHGKAEFISAAVEGALIALAGLMILYQVVYTFFHPVALNKLDVGIIITLITGVLNFLFGWYALRVARQQRSMTVEAAATHLKSDAYSTFAIVAGLILLHFTGWAWMDQLIAAIFGLVIIVTGYKVLRKSLAGIMDEANEQLLKDVLNILNEKRSAEWIDLHNLRIQQYGGDLHIDCHLTLPRYWDLNRVHDEIHDFEVKISEVLPTEIEIFVHVDPCLDACCSHCEIAECPIRKMPFGQKIDWNATNMALNQKHFYAL
jgi:cation diffusion facilitator family transporter